MRCCRPSIHIGLDQTKVLEFCRARGMPFVSYCPLGRGRLLENPAVGEIARSKGKTPAQIALRWLVQQQNVAAIPGTSTPKRALENLDVLGFSLTDAEMTRLHALARPDGRIVSPRGRAPAWD